jgi:hypothetical protein
MIMKAPKSTKSFIAALLLLAGCAVTNASAGTLMDVKVVDRSTGRTLETWRHRGQLYVVGTPGNRYAVQVANRSGGRVLGVVSVDGINVVSGETAAAPQSGYVLAPGQSADIAGWRKSMDEVAAFYFTSVADSYAGRTGRAENTGVIGVAVFQELVPPPVALVPQRKGYGESRDAASSGNAPAPASAPAAEGRMKTESLASSESAARAEKKLGTGHGERLNAPIEYTSFRRASSTPAELITIYYDSRANLMARGIIPDPRNNARNNARPNPFPGGFVPDPQG